MQDLTSVDNIKIQRIRAPRGQAAVRVSAKPAYRVSGLPFFLLVYLLSYYFLILTNVVLYMLEIA